MRNKHFIAAKKSPLNKTFKNQLARWSDDGKLQTHTHKKKEGEMKWQLIAVSCLSLRERHTGRVGAHPDTGIIAP